MSRIAKRLTALLGLLVVHATVHADEYQTFERKVRPLLVEHCYECHSAGAKTVHGGLRLDTAEGVRQGGDSGSVVVAGAPEESLLIETVRYDGDIQMPPDGKLSPDDLATLTHWVQQGAAFPPSEQTEQASHGAIDFDEGRRFWSFQPVQRQPLPDVGGSDLDANGNRRRTLYATVHRRDMSPTLMVHDFPDPTQHSPKRTPTITALQGLYALNGPLLLNQSQSLVTRLEREVPHDPAAQINRLYWLLFSRPPDDRELRIGMQFLKSPDNDSPAIRLQQYAHALLVSNQALFVE